MSGEKAGMERHRKKERINQRLREFGTDFQFEKVGDYQQGHIELDNPDSLFHLQDYLLVIEWSALIKSTGGPKKIKYISYGNRRYLKDVGAGVIIIPVVNHNSFFMIYDYGVMSQRKLLVFPRGFIPEGCRNLQEVSENIFRRKVLSRLKMNLTVQAEPLIFPDGKPIRVAENHTISWNWISVVVINFSLPTDLKPDQSFRLVPINEFDALCMQYQHIVDMHTLSAPIIFTKV